MYQTAESDRQIVAVREVEEAHLIRADTLTTRHVLFDQNRPIVDQEKVVRKVRLKNNMGHIHKGYLICPQSGYPKI